MRFLLGVCWLAAIVYATIPGYWFIVHPFAGFWRSRRRSPFRAVLPLWFLMMLVLAALTFSWHTERLYTTPLAWIPALLLFATAISIYRRIRKEFGVANFSGEAEVRPKEFPQQLITTGLHSRIRHPIYLAHLCTITASTVGSGLVVNYVLLAFAFLTGMFMVQLEERELARRFGEAFAQYKRHVPAIVPEFSFMRKRKIVSVSAVPIAVALIFTAAELHTQASATSAQSAKKDSSSAFSVFVGTWKGHGSMRDTKFSKAAEIDSLAECRLSRFGDFLLCDLITTNPAGARTGHQLTLYSADKDGAYTFVTIPQPGAEPHFDHLTIVGNTWTYSGKSGDGKTLFRTLNIFSKPGYYEFVGEYSEDRGLHWTEMLKGSATKQ